MKVNELYNLLTLLQTFKDEYNYDIKYIEDAINFELDSLEDNLSEEEKVE